MHVPVVFTGPRKDKAAGNKLRDDSGTKALRSSEQSGLASSFSILAHYFPTSSASFRADRSDFNWLVTIHRLDRKTLEIGLRGEGDAPAGQSESP